MRHGGDACDEADKRILARTGKDNFVALSQTQRCLARVAGAIRWEPILTGVKRHRKRSLVVFCNSLCALAGREIEFRKCKLCIRGLVWLQTLRFGKGSVEGRLSPDLAGESAECSTAFHDIWRLCQKTHTSVGSGRQLPCA